MKIGILGNYGHSNLGDEALLLGAIECVREDAEFNKDEIVVLSDDKKDTEVRLQGLGFQVRRFRRPYGGHIVRLPIVMLDIFRALEGLDWLVFGGGGLLNDSNRSAIPMYALVRVLAWFRGIRVAWWSVGIGPLEDGARKRLASWLLSSSSFFTVRDEDSRRMATEMISSRVMVAPDLAHALSYSKNRATHEHPTLAVSVIPYKKPGVWFEECEEQYLKYCDKMVGCIQELLDARPDIRIQLFPISLQQDGAAIADIMAQGEFHEHDRVGEYRPDSVYALLAEISRAKVMIATRLHSVVLATVAGVPAVSIAYQPKVASYARELPVELPCFGIDDFSSKDIHDALLATIDRSEELAGCLSRENAERRLSLRRATESWRTVT